MTQHPWKAWPEKLSSDGHHIAGRGAEIVADKEIVACVSSGYTKESQERAWKRANLIAAAPELYEALKACHLQMLQSNNDSEYAKEANELAVAAIARAEGRQ